MKAVRFYGQGDIRVEDIPRPGPEAGGLLVRIEVCALCGTDLKMYLKGDARVPVGQTIGHEFVGRIVEAGPDVTGFAVGERVTMATSIACGRCGFCRSGHTNRCDHLTPISRHYPGALAEYLAIPSTGVAGGYTVKVPASLGDLAALAEPLSCVVNAQILAGIKPADTVVVIGFGPLGALHVESARARGATRVFVVQRSAVRRNLAAQFHVDAVINPAEGDPADQVMRLTDGQGADVVVVCAPDPGAQGQALRMARKGGMVNWFAGLPRGESEVTVDSRLIHYREIFLSGASDSGRAHVETAVKLLETGRISDKIITHRFPIDRFPEALEQMRQGACLKILITP